MSDNTVLVDESTLSKADQLWLKAETFLTLLSGIIILSLVLLSVANVLGRWLFSLPIDGYIDWIEQSMTFFAFLGIAFVQRQGAHIRMDMVIGQMKNRVLWVMELITVMSMLAITSILIYGSYLHFYRAYQIGDSSLDIDLPTWPSKLVVPFALTILGIRLLLQIWAYISAIKNNTQKPIAVPLIENAKEQAMKEARKVIT